MENEKKFYRTLENGKICYRMVDLKSKTSMYYKRSKPCHLELDNKELVALNPDVDRSYGYKYTYKIVPDPNTRFGFKYEFVNEDVLIGEFVSEIKDKHF